MGAVLGGDSGDAQPPRRTLIRLFAGCQRGEKVVLGGAERGPCRLPYGPCFVILSGGEVLGNAVGEAVAAGRAQVELVNGIVQVPADPRNGLGVPGGVYCFVGGRVTGELRAAVGVGEQHVGQVRAGKRRRGHDRGQQVHAGAVVGDVGVRAVVERGQVHHGGGGEVLSLQEEGADTAQRVRAGHARNVVHAHLEGFEVTGQLTQLADVFVEIGQGLGDGGS